MIPSITSCVELLDLASASVLSIKNMSWSADVDVKQTLDDLRPKLKFSPNMFCHTPVENCYYTQSVQFPTSPNSRDVGERKREEEEEDGLGRGSTW